jgi:hypothetical protein
MSLNGTWRHCRRLERSSPTAKVGTFTQALCEEAKKDGWTVISIKNDWKRIFAFD